MRILGLDLGSKTLGVSVSDALGMIARPVETIRFESDDYEAACEQVQPYIKEFQVKTAVLGLPKHMNGDVGIRGEISLMFKEKLEALGLEVVLWDERLMYRARNVKKSLIRWRQYKFCKAILKVKTRGLQEPLYRRKKRC